MRSSTLALPLVAITVLGLAACATPTAEPETETASGALAVNIIASPHAEAVVAAFEESHPEIDVELTTTTLSFEDGSVQTHLRSGAGADVLLLNSGPGRIGLIAEAGLVLDISDLYAEGIDASYPEDVLSQITYDDAIYEIAEGRDIFQLHVNTDLFENAGVDVPTSWDELLDTCEPLAESGVRPFAVGARDNYAGGWLLGTLVQSAAGVEPVRDVLFGDGSIADDETVEGGEHLADLIDAGCIDGTEGLALEFEQALASFGQGQAAMIVGTQSTVPGLIADGFDTDSIQAIPMPSDDDANEIPTSGLALSWVISAATKNVPAAQEWMRWVASDEYLEVAIDNGMSLAPAHIVPDSVTLDPAVAQAVEAAGNGTGFNPSVYMSAATKAAWYAAVQGLLGKSADAQTLFDAVQAEFEIAREEAK
jgi:raffinose/stachyose/melibiose transport system substrate-binding protein